MRNFIFMLVVTLGFLTSCVARIDAGHEGMKVKLYGSDRGVNDINLVTGWVPYLPWSTKVYEYATFVQTIDYPEFTVNAKDGSEFTVDPTLSLKIIDGMSPTVFTKYRQPLLTIIKTTLFNYVKDAFRIQLNSYTTDEIVSQRDRFEKDIESSLRETLLKEGFQLEQLTSGLKYPETIVAAVNAKNKAVQEAMQVENEVRIAEAQARKVIVAAEAEKMANELRMKSLTPLLIQQEFVNKWDGKLPIYGEVPTLFKSIN
jgi:regulator of protease activity HflC (stomatin/prohibitin superfamily)